MCERNTIAGKACKIKTRYMVHIVTTPQPLGPNGAYGMERAPVGRSLGVCAAHLARTVDDLNDIPYRAYGAIATVRRHP